MAAVTSPPGSSNGKSGSNTDSDGVGDGQILEQTKSRTWRMRPEDDDEPQDWWFCSTAIPLLAATLGPMANVMSIAALVTSWRNTYSPANPGVDADSTGFKDPKWCLGLNGASLACGFVGNGFLLLNFTRRIRYIVALPMTIILWYFATGILIGITISMNEYVPPKHPTEVYSQGYWYAVIAAVLYLIASMILMLNMLGYFLGHYPQHFELTDEQRNLILQTMMFFVWLAGGAAVFAKVEGWSFVDSLYFCDVTILTVGFGDFHPINDAGRGLVFPYSVGGIIILGLMVSSIHKFAGELSQSHVVRRHVEKARTQTLSRSVTNEVELEEKKVQMKFHRKSRAHPTISAPQNPQKRTVAFDEENAVDTPRHLQKSSTFRKGIKTVRRFTRRRTKKNRILMLREERDRFDQMRAIQRETHNFKRYSALTMSVLAFGILWCVGAVGFWRAERYTQGLSYFQALYFCYVSLLTIGYGDLSPTSNLGKPLFLVWSLVAIPTMTILISDMGDTVIASFKRGTFKLADWTIMPKEGIWRAFIDRHPWLYNWLLRKQQERDREKRLREGFQTGPSPDDEDGGDDDPGPPTLEEVAKLDTLDDVSMARRLAAAIRRTANDLHSDPPKRYSYEEWAEYTRLIRFTRMDPDQIEATEEDEGLVEWDWIGEDSPMMADESESEWVLDRLCESMGRYMRKLRLVTDTAGNNTTTSAAGQSDGVDVKDSAAAAADSTSKELIMNEDNDELIEAVEDKKDI